MNYKINMTLYFNQYEPLSLEPMRLIEEADTFKIEPVVELSDDDLQTEMQYD